MQKTNIPDVIKNIELLITKNVLKVTPEKYLVIIAGSLWEQFDNQEKQTTVLRNLKLFCELKNAYAGVQDTKQKLQLCVKNANDKVIALYELHDDKVMKKELEPLLEK